MILRACSLYPYFSLICCIGSVRDISDMPVYHSAFFYIHSCCPLIYYTRTLEMVQRKH